MGGTAFHVEDVNGKKLVHIRPKEPRYRVLLSIDGGGIRGVIPATILQGFERCVKEVIREHDPDLNDIEDEDMIVDVADCFDTIAGNSAGSILALYFASGGGSEEMYGKGKPLGNLRPGSAAALVKTFDVLARDIFAAPLRERIPIVRRLSWFFATRYNSKGLEKGLRKGFGDLTLQDLKKSTYIPAYQTDKPRPCAFWCRKVNPDVRARTGYACLHHCNQPTLPALPELGEGEDNPLPDAIPFTHQFPSLPTNVPLRIVAQASSSAPIYFPKTEYSKKAMRLPVDEGEDDTISWVDGALVSNNPMLQALFFMSSNYAECGQRFLPPGNLAVLSIGTGATIEAPRIGGRQGLLNWGGELVNVLMSAHTALNSVLVDNYFFGGTDEMNGEEPDRYIRINKIVERGDPDFKALHTLDDVSKVPQMKDIASKVVEEEWEKMKVFVKRILMA